MLAEMEKAKGAREPNANRGATPSPGSSASPQRPLRDLGISRDESSTWQRLARVPKPAFERALSDAGNQLRRDYRLVGEIDVVEATKLFLEQ